ncbi:unnamed protein product [Trichogramma brassicae]|uniref:Uncharacterized protein n=1 Tax=Trichogramma brassicae TaxID=86971 RepID=A0A6H5IKF8_9HYME|nr:unnamed protein product [Trichogramma brassicae]
MCTTTAFRVGRGLANERISKRSSYDVSYLQWLFIDHLPPGVLRLNRRLLKLDRLIQILLVLVESK